MSPTQQTLVCAFFLTCAMHIQYGLMEKPRHIDATLLSFEQHIALGPTFAARLLGISYVTYAQYRSGYRPLQLYHERHIEALRALIPERLEQLKKEHAYGTGKTK